MSPRRSGDMAKAVRVMGAVLSSGKHAGLLAKRECWMGLGDLARTNYGAVAARNGGVESEYLDVLHLSCRLHLTLNLSLPLRNLHIPLLIFLKVFLGPSNNLLYRGILFQKV
jgi:hypothetical protein